MKFLITGGSGFIGRRLARRLIEKGEGVRILDSDIHPAKHLSHLGVELRRGSVLDREAVSKALEGCQGLYHMAALFEFWQLDPRAYYRVNVEGTRTVLRQALQMGLERVVHTSSACTIGEGNGRIGAEGTPHRGYFLSDYERSKCLAEQEALELAEAGLPLVCVNPTSVYGPGQTRHLGQAIVSFLRGRLPVIVNSRLNFAYVEDVVQGHILAQERGLAGHRYILGGENSTLVEFLSLAARIAGSNARPRPVPAWCLYPLAYLLDMLAKIWGRPPRLSPDQVRVASHTFLFDSSLAQRELGLQVTPLEEGLRATIEWLKEAGHL